MTADRLPLPWKDLRRAFEFDGSLRDIVIADADLTLWQQAVDHVRGLGRAGPIQDDEGRTPLPHAVEEIFRLAAQGDARLSVDLGGIRINCFFFTDDEIEFDLDPREVASEQDAKRVLGFMRGLAEATSRQVDLRDESHLARWLTFDPATSRWILGIGLQ